MQSLRRWFVNDGFSEGEDRFDLLRVVPFLLLHAGAVLACWVGVAWIDVAVAVAFYWLRMFAITGFYHRYFSHRAFEASRAVQFAFALLAASAAQRGPLWWAGVHRRHHAEADTDSDPHSPRRGFLHAHVGWFLKRKHFATDLDRVKDWSRFPELMWLDRYDSAVPIAAAVAMFGLGAALQRWLPALSTSGLQMLLWGYCVSTVILLHATLLVNSVTHRFGERRYATRDDSRNLRWLAWLTLGEGWHNNHHRYAAAARQGFFAGEIDLSYRMLRLLERAGLVRNLRAVPPAILAEGRGR
jgi:stearoyl-CoA desaturase (delta-9 desaturase)